MFEIWHTLLLLLQRKVYHIFVVHIADKSRWKILGVYTPKNWDVYTPKIPTKNAKKDLSPTPTRFTCKYFQKERHLKNNFFKISVHQLFLLHS